MIASAVSLGPRDRLRVFTTKGAKIDISTRKYRVSGRGGKGIEVIKRGGLSGAAIGEHEIPGFDEDGPQASAPAKGGRKKTRKKTRAKQKVKKGGGKAGRKKARKPRKK